MYRILWLINVILVTPTGAFAAKTVECTDPATGDKKMVRVGTVRGGLKAVRRLMQKEGVHILDLPQAVQERHEYLSQFLAEENWCFVNSHVMAIEDALEAMRIDQSFIADKFGRVERWARTGITAPSDKLKVERWMANAAAHMADQRYGRANGVLNKAMGLMFGSTDVWILPSKLPEPVETKASVIPAPPVRTKEVEAGCPSLGKRGKANRDELTATLAKLRKLMDKRAIRPMDLKGGEQLVNDLQSYVKLAAVWPATRITCAMIERTRALEIDLGVVQKRFQRVKNLKEDRGVPSGSNERFTQLVRSASNHLMSREFEPAHHDLDALLVLLGESSRPSHGIP
ncbi:hypothetical protein ACFL6C_03425 [Myxococcota bacterium]